MTLPLQGVTWYTGEVALASRFQWTRCDTPAVHPALPARVSQVPAAGQRRPQSLREWCEADLSFQGSFSQRNPFSS